MTSRLKNKGIMALFYKQNPPLTPLLHPLSESVNKIDLDKRLLGFWTRCMLLYQLMKEELVDSEHGRRVEGLPRGSFRGRRGLPKHKGRSDACGILG